MTYNIVLAHRFWLAVPFLGRDLSLFRRSRNELYFNPVGLPLAKLTKMPTADRCALLLLRLGPPTSMCYVTGACDVGAGYNRRQFRRRGRMMTRRRRGGGPIGARAADRHGGTGTQHRLEAAPRRCSPICVHAGRFLLAVSAASRTSASE